MTEERAPVLQWVGLFLAPAAFFAHLQVGYALVPWSCVHGTDAWMHVSGATAFALALGGSFAAWRTWMRAGHEVPGEGGGALARTRFLGAVGLGVSIALSLILLAQWIVALFIGVCQ
jgi:hypothetical protein